MRRRTAVIAGVFLLAGVAWLQVLPSGAKTAAQMMPAGPLVYLEAKDFGRLLADWNGSRVKAKWLASSNYAVFANSNLLQKISGVGKEYSEASGMAPGLAEVLQIAGTESALGLYDARELQFLYITKMPNAKVTQSELWTLRDKFERRQAAGVEFYLRTDKASGRTVAFAFSQGMLFVATRDDLVARALALQSGGTEPALTGESWYADAVRASTGAGELRMVLNMDALARNTYFRSYWIQRNVTELKGFRAEVTDLDRTAAEYTERRVLLRQADAPDAAVTDAQRSALAQLAHMAPGDAGLYRAWARPDPARVTDLVRRKILYPEVQGQRDERYAPGAPVEQSAGTEADLETRIDEAPLQVQAAASDGLARLLRSVRMEALLEVQSSEQPAGSDFLAMPCVLVIRAESAWDAAAVRAAIADDLSRRISVGGLGLQWAGVGLDGLAPVRVEARGNNLYLSNSAELSAAVQRPSGDYGLTDATYLAGFRHAREHAGFVRIMKALDAGAAPDSMSDRGHPYFSDNWASLSEALGVVGEVNVSRSEKADRVGEVVRYGVR